MKRLIRKAALVNVDVDDENLIQYITNCMANKSVLEIDYEGSGIRNILPYGWYESKEGNSLLMCYKTSTDEVRSYRLDRISAFRIDSSNIDDYVENNIRDFNIPEIPDIDTIIKETEKELPYNQALDYLDNSSDIPMVPESEEETIEEPQTEPIVEEPTIKEPEIEEPIEEPVEEIEEEPMEEENTEEGENDGQLTEGGNEDEGQAL